MDWMELIKQFGPMVAACAFFIWQSWIRENKLGVQLEKGNEFARTTMADLIRGNTEAMHEFKASIDAFRSVVEDCPGNGVPSPRENR